MAIRIIFAILLLFASACGSHDKLISSSNKQTEEAPVVQAEDESLAPTDAPVKGVGIFPQDGETDLGGGN